MEDGDRNTKFFHRVASMRRRFNAIDKIVVEGGLHGDVSSVKDAIVHFYEKMYHKDASLRPFLEGTSYNSIGEEDALELIREFAQEEVWKTINELGKDKVPGLMVLILLFLALLELGMELRGILWAYLLIFTSMAFLRKP